MIYFLEDMKRARGCVAVPPLPCEVWFHIARMGDWRESGPLARTCTRFLRHAVTREILGEVVASCLQRGVLLRWLTLALPCGAWIPLSVPRLLSDVSVVGDVAHFLTGGAVAQRLYAREWDSDVDVWIEERLFNAARITGDTIGRRLDLVAHRGPAVHGCIERFDLSVVQQGYYHGTGEAYATPLALYSFLWKVLVALPSRECIEYTGSIELSPFRHRPRVVRRLEVDIWHYIERHDADYEMYEAHHNGAYHECTLCGMSPISAGHQPFQRWRKRMLVYARRFAEFAVVYSKAHDDVAQVHVSMGRKE